ncbi:collagen alpha-1(I) chain-like [Chionomys nivalis]|uniref:collagen alpha-1(I) chain-like n=1 Tax=Chionomys nivalis TaxID=269649 RepID=UPI0025984F27|nr:collagen alpha-1(I) chain-like [Chionomys nivalis]
MGPTLQRHPFSGLVDSAGIVHHLSGPNACARAPPPRRGGRDGPVVRPRRTGRGLGIPPRAPATGPFTFIAPRRLSDEPLTRAHVRLLGPCFKTGRVGSRRRRRPRALGSAPRRERRDRRTPPARRRDDARGALRTVRPDPGTPRGGGGAVPEPVAAHRRRWKCARRRPQPDSGKTRARRAGGRYRPHTVHGLGLDQKDLGPPRAAPGSGSSPLPKKSSHRQPRDTAASRGPAPERAPPGCGRRRRKNGDGGRETRDRNRDARPFEGRGRRASPAKPRGRVRREDAPRRSERRDASRRGAERDRGKPTGPRGRDPGPDASPAPTPRRLDLTKGSPPATARGTEEARGTGREGESADEGGSRAGTEEQGGNKKDPRERGGLASEGRARRHDRRTTATDDDAGTRELTAAQSPSPPAAPGEVAGERRGGFASGRPARTRKKHTRKAGRDRQTRGPRPTTHRRTGHAEASPTGAREGAPEPRPRRASGTATRRVRNGSPREPPDADGSLRAPPTPRPRGRRARYPDRGRGRRREREDRRRDDAPGRAPSRDTGSVRHARPGATARGRAGRRRGALPFPPDGGDTDAHHPPETEHGRAGRERGDTPAGRCGAVRQQRELDGGEREREEEPPSTVSRQRRAEHGSPDGARRASEPRERAAHDGTRTDEREKSEREEGGGWPEPREATRREPPSRRETDALPRDAPRLLTTPRFQAGGRGRALESGCGAATGNRQSGRRHTAPTGLAGETGGGPPPGREAEAEGTGTPRKAGPRACSETRRERREGERGDDTQTVFPSRDGRGDAAAHDARTGRTSGTGRVIDRSPHRRRTGGKKKHASGGYLTARHPTRCGGGSPHETCLPGGRRRRRGRKSPQTHLGRRTHRHAADDGRPLSLLPSRGSRNARSPPLSHPLARTHRRDRRARRRRRTPRRRRAPTRPATRRETTDRRSPKAAPEREVTTPQSQNRIPGPEEGRVNRCSPTVGTLPGRGSEATPTRHTTRATHARDARSEAAVRGNGKDGEAREGPHAAGTDGGRVGPGSPPPPSPALFPARLRAPTEARTHPRGSGGSGSRGTRARAHAAPSFPATGNTSRAPARHAGVTTRSLVPRGSSPDSERGGAGRSGRHKRSGFPPQRRDAARGTRPKLRASGGQGVLGRPGGPTGDPKHARSSDR